MQLKAATTYPAIVGSLLATTRQARRLEQAEVATKVGLTQSTWSRIERGESALTIEQLYRASQALGEKPSSILASADRAANGLKSRGIDVQDMKVDEAIQQGLAVIGFAALCVLVAKMLSK